MYREENNNERQIVMNRGPEEGFLLQHFSLYKRSTLNCTCFSFKSLLKFLSGSQGCIIALILFREKSGSQRITRIDFPNIDKTRFALLPFSTLPRFRYFWYLIDRVLERLDNPIELSRSRCNPLPTHTSVVFTPHSLPELSRDIQLMKVVSVGEKIMLLPVPITNFQKRIKLSGW